MDQTALDLQRDRYEGRPSAGVSSPGMDALRHALFDSRQRWRDLVTLAADLVFETDAQGRFTFIAPDPAVGWPSVALMGQPGDTLLADAADQQVFNPFRPTAVVRRRTAWVKRPDGTPVCLAFSTTPLLDACGAVVGARGIAHDLTEQASHDAAAAAALRRCKLIDHILWRMRQEVLAPRMMAAALDALMLALGAEGCAVIDLLGDGTSPEVTYEAGESLDAVTPTLLAAIDQGGDHPVTDRGADGRPLLVCPAQTRFGEHACLTLWRSPDGRFWDVEDTQLANSAGGIIRVILEHDAIQREMARQAHTDPLTGLLNRRALVDEMTRRIERLEREGLPGTLMFVDLDNFKALNDRRGHDVGDEALRITAGLLRATFRPLDLVARLGGDEFAVWLDGADGFTAAERAETLRIQGPAALAHLTPPDPQGEALDGLTMSIGIATRWPGQGEDVASLITRADQVMYSAKRAGRGQWRVSGPSDA